MPDGGRLDVIIRTVGTPEDPVRVRFMVRDTGAGIAPEAVEHIFDPFFTTKEPGEGTGLGLSTVHTAVQQTGGTIRVASEPNFGTTFEILFPPAAPAAANEVDGGSETVAQRGHETVLLCEDDDAIRDLVTRILEKAGYTVLAAAAPRIGVALAMETTRPIDLLVTDVVMPQMNGVELARAVGKDRPNMGVLYISGYTAQAIGHHGVLDTSVALLEKPFSTAALLRRVREVLDGD